MGTNNKIKQSDQKFYHTCSTKVSTFFQIKCHLTVFTDGLRVTQELIRRLKEKHTNAAAGVSGCDLGETRTKLSTVSDTLAVQ